MKNLHGKLVGSFKAKTMFLFTVLIFFTSAIYVSNTLLTNNTVNLLTVGTEQTFPMLQKLDASIPLVENYQVRMGDAIGQSDETYLDEAQSIAAKIVKNLDEVALLDPSKAPEVKLINAKFTEFTKNSETWARKLLSKGGMIESADPEAEKYFQGINQSKNDFTKIREAVKTQYLKDLKTSQTSAALTIRIGLIILLLSFICAGGALFYTQKYVIAPITDMAKCSIEVSEGRFETTKDVELSDEIGQLIKYFNIMVRNSEASKKAILILNESLAEQVLEKTRDIKVMLENTKIGLFSVTKDFTIDEHYARYLETILGQKQLAGKNFSDLILEKSKLGSDSKALAMSAIDYSFGEDELSYLANEHCFPRELEVEFGGELKHLDLDWSPVFDANNNVEKILVSIRDVTETLKLKKEAEQGKRSVKLLGELIEIGPDKFAKVERDLLDGLQRVARIVENGKNKGIIQSNEIRQAYIILHTMKGSVRMHKMTQLTDSVHEAEEAVTGISELNGDNIKVLKQKIEAIRESHRLYVEAFKPILSLKESIQKNLGQSSQNKLFDLLEEMGSLGNDLAKDIGKGGCILKVELPVDLVVPDEFVTALSQALVHLVRNSVDHGLELPDERIARGKDLKGTIRVFMDDRGRIGFGDDGKGLNVEKIRQKATKLGLRYNTQEELVNLIFSSGFSTKDNANDISGRGVGMDAVRSFLCDVGCDIQIVPLLQDGDFMKFYFAIDLPQTKLQKAV